MGTVPEDDPRRCRATNRQGERCRRASIRGGFVCHVHGGGSPAVKAKALQRLRAAEVENFVAGQASGWAEVDGPMTMAEVLEELMKTARLAVRWRDLLEQIVGSLSEMRYTAHGSGAEQLRAEIALFERAMDRVAKVSEAIARLDLDARMAALSEKQGRQVVEAVERTVARVPELTAEQRAAFLLVLPEELRALGERPRAGVRR